ncbi:MAG: manganese-dependent inorganic pyrophosphatase [Leptotrichiaceae bacterium]|jgi:manganese-dependent inorganic pyrophosphatase|nr:manganese-dependent inorganic pyrophosphatase [Leptotrichiaceae bacterium]MBP6167805.1 manganese-dependent inorganic pyrophosphatase [Leptotrichiaceae bacterium]MBP7026701.1 manganese-dependent inorganic pyrophosphatase [Leptotrichiaceae bacterium]MBP9876409.1 manganese-dependent inorganic pyrophosphatase [Leptotrichiaceae bacterium]
MEILVIGHKNPDTDSICSAIAYSELKNKLGQNTKPVRAGELNKETEFVMDYFKSEIPALNPDISGRDVILVDHNERTQTADGFEGAKILELIDHHRIANFNVDEPLKVRMEPVGCTSTIIFDMYKENGLLPDKITAGLMLSAIISDTLLFKSPTCTEKDTIAGRELSKIAEIDLAVYGVEMLKAGTALDDKTINELLNMDMKIFDVNDFKIGIAQINAVDEKAILAKKEEILLEISNIMKSDNLNMFMFVVTNILTNNSMGLVAGEKQEIVEKAFNSKIINSELTLEGIVSRKKQIVPPLTKALSN